jgi:hypothetical protein
MIHIYKNALSVMWGNCLRSTQKPSQVAQKKKETLTGCCFSFLYLFGVIVNDYEYVAMQEKYISISF